MRTSLSEFISHIRECITRYESSECLDEERCEEVNICTIYDTFHDESDSIQRLKKSQNLASVILIRKLQSQK